MLDNNTLKDFYLKWNINNLNLIRENQNHVFSCNLENKLHILRVTNIKHRTYEELESELTWIMFLFNNDINVSKPIYSKKGNLIEQLNFNNKTYFTSLFTYIEGEEINIKNVNENLLFYWGKELGKIHKLSSNNNFQIKRKFFFDNKYLKLDLKKLQRISNELFHSIKQINNTVINLETNKNNFGLIHGDSINFHFKDNKITFFDFDDCSYNWFTFDIANGLYSLYFDTEQNNKSFDFKYFIHNFLKGYKLEMEISDNLELQIRYFINYRIALLYQWLNIPENSPLWVNNITNEWKNNLLNWTIKKLSDIEII